MPRVVKLRLLPSQFVLHNLVQVHVGFDELRWVIFLVSQYKLLLLDKLINCFLDLSVSRWFLPLRDVRQDAFYSVKHLPLFKGIVLLHALLRSILFSLLVQICNHILRRLQFLLHIFDNRFFTLLVKGVHVRSYFLHNQLVWLLFLSLQSCNFFVSLFDLGLQLFQLLRIEILVNVELSLKSSHLVFKVTPNFVRKEFVGAGRNLILLLDHLKEVILPKILLKKFPDSQRTIQIQLCRLNALNLHLILHLLSFEFFRLGDQSHKSCGVEIWKFEPIFV